METFERALAIVFSLQTCKLENQPLKFLTGRIEVYIMKKHLAVLRLNHNLLCQYT